LCEPGAALPSGWCDDVRLDIPSPGSCEASPHGQAPACRVRQTRNAEKVVIRTIELDRQPMQSEFDAVQNKMPNVFFITCLDLAQTIFQIFELPLDQKIRTTRSIRVFLRLENEPQDGAALRLPGYRGRSGALRVAAIASVIGSAPIGRSRLASGRLGRTQP
jgi:hypothetical protein